MHKIVIAFGSQTGCSQSIAEELYTNLTKEGYSNAVLRPLNYFKDNINEMKESRLLIIVVSTTGNGDPPDNASDLWRFLKKKTLSNDFLDGVRFAVLGLGDTNYDQFCRMGKALDKRLPDLGAERVFNLACADEATGLDAVVAPWMLEIMSVISTICGYHKVSDHKINDGMLSESKASTEPNLLVVEKENHLADGCALNGMSVLQKLLAQKGGGIIDSRKSAVDIVVGFGSQSGRSEDIARNIATKIKSWGYPNISCNPLNEYSKNLPSLQSKILIVVCSTHSDGDPPKSAEIFFRSIRKKTLSLDTLVGLKYSVLAIGDTNYSMFCRVGKAINTRLGELGGSSFYNMVCADDALGLDSFVESYKDGLKVALLDLLENKIATESKKEEKKTEMDQNNLLNSSTNTIPNLPIASQNTSEEEKKNPWYSIDGVKSFNELFPSYSVQVINEKIKSKLPKLSKCNVVIEYSNEIALSSPSSLNKSSKEDFIYNSKTPFYSKINEAKYLTSSTYVDKPVVFLSLDVTGSNIIWVPGDSIGVMPQNDSKLVNDLLKRLNLERNANKVINIYDKNTREISTEILSHLPPNSTLFNALSCYLDLTSLPRKALLRELSARCSDPLDEAKLSILCSKDGKEEYRVFVEEQNLNILEILNLFPSCFPTAEQLFQHLLPSTPRYYSVASSPLDNPNIIDIAFSVLNYTTKGNVNRRGLCTNFMHDIAKQIIAGDKSNKCLAIFPFPTRNFTLPSDLSVPMILIGPGTGVVPYVSFLNHRQAQRKKIAESKLDVCSGYWRGCDIDDIEEEDDEGEVYCSPKKDSTSFDNKLGETFLYFGCRYSDKDFIFENELKSFERNSIISKLRCAFSRDKAEKEYVSHLMIEDGKQIADLLLNRGASVYVCGEGTQMALTIHHTLIEIFSKHGGMTNESASVKLEQMMSKNKYVRDIFS